MDCSRRRVLACIACVSDRCNAIDTLRRNHVHNKLMEGPHLAHSLDANVAHCIKNRSDLSDNAPYVSRAKSIPQDHSLLPTAFYNPLFLPTANITASPLLHITKTQVLKSGSSPLLVQKRRAPAFQLCCETHVIPMACRHLACQLINFHPCNLEVFRDRRKSNSCPFS